MSADTSRSVMHELCAPNGFGGSPRMGDAVWSPRGSPARGDVATDAGRQADDRSGRPAGALPTRRAHMSNDFSIWDVFVSMFWFMLLFAWIMLLFHIIADIFRDRELSGFAKALWCLFLIFIPWIGALVYLIARGNSMAQRSL